MGGASSKFEETQWWNASGELVAATEVEEEGISDDNNDHPGTPATIVPNEDPTPQLQLYDIIKQSLTSQRDFEVRDGSRNVLYVTKSVPGTLAWFDVLRAPPAAGNHQEGPTNDKVAEEENWGKEITEEPIAPSQEEGEPENSNGEQDPPSTASVDADADESSSSTEPPDPNLLLRVQVDLSRRTWIVYRYHTPVFSGQAAAHLDVRKGLADHVRLYKVCCITVSWSRCLAIAARYGPPTRLQDFLGDPGGDNHNHNHNIDDDDIPRDSSVSNNSSTQDLFGQAQHIAARRREENNLLSPTSSQQSKHQNDEQNGSKNESASPLHDHEDDTNSLGDPWEGFQDTNENAAAAEASTKDATATTSSSAMQTVANSVSAVLARLEDTLPSSNTKQKLAATTRQPTEALEGVVDLEAPLLHCQEIYNKLSANHQTCLVDKEQVVKLWELDHAYKRGNSTSSSTSDHTTPGSSSYDPLGKAVAYEREAHPLSEDMETIKQWWLETYRNGGDNNNKTDASVDDNATAPSTTSSSDDKGNDDKEKKSWFHFQLPKRESTPSGALGELQLAEGRGEDNDGEAGKEEETTSSKDEPQESLPETEEVHGGKSSSSLSEPPSVEEEEEVRNEPAVPKVYGSSQGVVRNGKDGDDDVDDPNRKEPLVAYWRWKNTYTTHKMQMHLAKNSDLALHVVLAIILNILRYERNALAIPM